MSRNTDQSSGQMTLAGFAARKPGDRLFFAVFPDAQAADCIVATAKALRDEHGLRGKPLRAERVHVTLHHLGDHFELPKGIISVAIAAVARVSMTPFEVRFDCASSFAGHARNKPLVLRGDEAALSSLFLLQRELGERMKDAGSASAVDCRFVPHVTLLYDERALPTQTIEPIAWTVREFALVHSLLGKTEHRILRKWPLG